MATNYEARARELTAEDDALASIGPASLWARPAHAKHLDQLVGGGTSVSVLCLDWCPGVAEHCIDADLNGADLSMADLDEADLLRATLGAANLSMARLLGADLRGADLNEANLNLADLSEADLRNADLSKANLSRARFRETILSDLRFEQLQRPRKLPPPRPQYH